MREGRGGLEEEGIQGVSGSGTWGRCMGGGREGLKQGVLMLAWGKEKGIQEGSGKGAWGRCVGGRSRCARGGGGGLGGASRGLLAGGYLRAQGQVRGRGRGGKERGNRGATEAAATDSSALLSSKTNVMLPCHPFIPTTAPLPPPPLLPAPLLCRPTGPPEPDRRRGEPQDAPDRVPSGWPPAHRPDARPCIQ